MAVRALAEKRKKTNEKTSFSFCLSFTVLSFPFLSSPTKTKEKTKLSEEELEEFKAAFAMFDTDGDGRP